jgi:uncharacterized membrane protein
MKRLYSKAVSQSSGWWVIDSGEQSTFKDGELQSTRCLSGLTNRGHFAPVSRGMRFSTGLREYLNLLS